MPLDNAFEAEPQRSGGAADVATGGPGASFNALLGRNADGTVEEFGG